MMKIALSILAALTFLASPALAQTPAMVKLCVQTSPTVCTPVSGTAPLPTTSGGGGSPSQVVGNVASGAADSGNPVKVGGVFNPTMPSFTAGQRGDVQINSFGGLLVGSSVAQGDGKSNNATQLNAGSAGGSNTSNSTAVYGYALNTAGTWDRLRSMPTADAQAVTGFQGTGTVLINSVGTYDRMRGINGVTVGNAGTGILAAAIAPTANAGGGIVSVVSPSAENSRVLKASAGNLYSAYAANHTATAGFLLVLNATAVPADGAVTPLECAALPANGNASVSYNPGPASVYSTGITVVLSSGANCFTKTTGVITGFIRGSVQ